MKTFTATLSSIKETLRLKYNIVYEFITLYLLAITTHMVRRLIILNGKDPNYVAPTSSEFTAISKWDKLDQEQVAYKKEKLDQFLKNPYSPLGGDWIKEPNKHPILKGRAKWIGKELSSRNNQRMIVPMVGASEIILKEDNKIIPAKVKRLHKK